MYCILIFLFNITIVVVVVRIVLLLLLLVVVVVYNFIERDIIYFIFSWPLFILHYHYQRNCSDYTSWLHGACFKTLVYNIKFT